MVNEEDNYPVGSFVKIVGLWRYPELNGATGIVNSFDNENGKYEVLLLPIEQMVRVKAVNLTLQEDDHVAQEDGFKKRIHQNLAFQTVQEVRTMNLKPGSLVKITGLEKQKALNGTFGVVKKFDSGQVRYEVIPTRRHGTVCIKPDNLTQEAVVKPTDPDFKVKRHKHAAFWPHSKIPIQALAGCDPTFLKNTLGWKNPQVFSVPDFVFTTMHPTKLPCPTRRP